MNIPLIVGESCLKINERIREVINELELKSARFNENDAQIIKRCIERLEVLNNQIYTQVLGEFLESMRASVKETQVSDISATVGEIINVVSSNFSGIPATQHESAFEVIKNLDNEESLTQILKMISDPEKLKNLFQS